MDNFWFWIALAALVTAFTSTVVFAVFIYGTDHVNSDPRYKRGF